MLKLAFYGIRRGSFVLLSGGGQSPFALPGAPKGCPRPRHTATRSTRQPAYEAARLILQHSHSGCRGGYLPVSGQLTSQVVVLHRTQRFGEDVSQLFVSVDIGELNLFCLYFLSQPVVFDVEMLRSLRQLRVSGYLDAGL